MSAVNPPPAWVCVCECVSLCVCVCECVCGSSGSAFSRAPTAPAGSPAPPVLIWSFLLAGRPDGLIRSFLLAGRPDVTQQPGQQGQPVWPGLRPAPDLCSGTTEETTKKFRLDLLKHSRKIIYSAVLRTRPPSRATGALQDHRGPPGQPGPSRTTGRDKRSRSSRDKSPEFWFICTNDFK